VCPARRPKVRPRDHGNICVRAKAKAEGLELNPEPKAESPKNKPSAQSLEPKWRE